MEEIYLIGKKQDLINIIESHIANLLASGYDNCDNPELNICYNFLMQLDETSEFLPRKQTNIIYHPDFNKNL